MDEKVFLEGLFFSVTNFIGWSGCSPLQAFHIGSASEGWKAFNRHTETRRQAFSYHCSA
jgi:hypothetical protein